MTKMWKSSVKLRVKSSVNRVYYFVQNSYSRFYPQKNNTLLHHFSLQSHRLINSIFSPVPANSFPLLHTPYYYNYDLYKYNNINKRKDKNGDWSRPRKVS